MDLPTESCDDDGLLDVPGRLKGLVVKEKHEDSKSVFPRLSRSAGAPKKATSTDYGNWFVGLHRRKAVSARTIASRDFEVLVTAAVGL